MSLTRTRKTGHALDAHNEGSPVFSPEEPREIECSGERRRVRYRSWELWAERLALIFLVAVFAVKAFVPAWLHLNSDFPNYYLVARLYRAGYPLERIYDWIWLQRQKDHQGIEQGLVSFIPSTIPSALVVAPWCSLPPLAAKHRWLVLNVVLLVFTGFLLCRMTKLRWERVALVMFLASVPLRNNFLFGQMHVLVLLLLTLAAWLFFRRFQLLAGITIAVAAALKIYPALFLIYFVWKRQWRAAAGVTIGVVSAVIGAFYLFGKGVCRLYAVQVLPAGLRGESLDPYNPAWNSWTALLRRLFIAEPELNPTPVAHLPWLYALLHPLIHGFILIVFLWAIGSQQRNTERTKLEWAVFLFLLLFLSSQPGSYHFVALILTAALVFDYLYAHERWHRIAIVATVYALICGPIIRFPWVTPNGWQNLLFFPRLGWMAIFGCLLLAMLLPRSRELLLGIFSLENTLVAGSALIALVIVGFFVNERHLRGQFEHYQARIATTPGNLLASEPAASGAGIFFTRMTRGGYTVSRVYAGTVQDFPTLRLDLLHAATSGKANLVWAEESSSKGSRIVQLVFDPGSQQNRPVTEAENAEEPVVSSDGHFLSFLRPIEGRNSLWIRQTGGQPGSEREIAGENYNVHEATFLPDNRVIFSSKQNGRFRLFVATQQGDVEELKNPNCSARYPAISPDGRWMAFSCEHGGSTQIHVMEWPGREELQLTSGDCNSIGPAWAADSKRLIYATDCGRGLGLTALAEVSALH